MVVGFTAIGTISDLRQVGVVVFSRYSDFLLQ